MSTRITIPVNIQLTTEKIIVIFILNINAVCKFFNKKSVQIVEANSHISG